MLNSETEPTSFIWIPDTGSDVDAVGIKQLTRLGGFIENLDDDDETVYSASGTALKNVGKIKVQVLMMHCCRVSPFARWVYFLQTGLTLS